MFCEGLQCGAGVQCGEPGRQHHRLETGGQSHLSGQCQGTVSSQQAVSRYRVISAGSVKVNSHLSR